MKNLEYKKQKGLFIPKTQDILGSYARLNKIKEIFKGEIRIQHPLETAKQVQRRAIRESYLD